jgi:hypothetical protein
MKPHFGGALFLIGLGVVFLLDNLGVLPGSAWAYVWPLLLVAFGLSLMLGWRGGHFIEAVAASQPLEGASQAHIHVKHGAGRLTVDAGEHGGNLLAGTFGGGLHQSARHIDGQLDVDLTPAPPDWTVWPWQAWQSGIMDWQMHVNPDIPVALEFETGASDSQLDLSQLHVTDLALKTGASATDLTLPAAAGATSARVESGVASVHITVPRGVAARIRGAMGLGALNVNTRRFPRRGDRYESDDFVSAPNRVDLLVQGGVGEVSVN